MISKFKKVISDLKSPALIKKYQDLISGKFEESQESVKLDLKAKTLDEFL